MVGLAARTRRWQDVRITPASAEERFAERLRPHRVASGQEPPDLRVPGLLAGTGVNPGIVFRGAGGVIDTPSLDLDVNSRITAG